MSSFSELGLNKRLCRAVDEMGWREPTPIQREAVPVGMSGKDLLGQAQTGTGKTGAYALSAIGRTKSGSQDPTVVVLAPTRELAEQVSREMAALSRYTRHSVVPVYGGVSYVEQTKGLAAGCDIVVGTPGRILDLCSKGTLRFGSVKELVIDEADRMLDMGFIDDVDQIVSMMPERRQTMMFSATLSDEVRAVAERTMKEPVEVTVSSDSMVPDLVRQYYVETKRNGKMDVLRAIMENGEPKMAVFCSTKKMVDDLFEGLSREGIRVGAIHGDMPQSRREKAIDAFRKGRTVMLIATDVAARGLDIDDIECVVNYDAPIDPETYTHRIGRAGRAGRTGTSFTFVTPHEDRRIPSYEAFTGMAVERVTRKQIPGIQVCNPELRSLHPERKRPALRKQQPSQQRKPRPTDATVISVNIPRSLGATRDDVSGLVCSAAGVGSESVGRIGVAEGSVFVEVESSKAEDIVRSLNGIQFMGRKLRASIAPARVRHKEGGSDAGARSVKSVK